MFENYTNELMNKILCSDTILIQNEYKNRQLVFELLEKIQENSSLQQKVIIVFPMKIFYTWKQTNKYTYITSYEDVYYSMSSNSKIFFIENYFFKLMISKSLIEENSIIFIDENIQDKFALKSKIIRFIGNNNNLSSTLENIFPIKLEKSIPTHLCIPVFVPESEILSAIKKLNINLKNEVIFNFKRGIFKTNQYTLNTIVAILNEELQEEEKAILEMHNEIKLIFISEIEKKSSSSSENKIKSIKKYKTQYLKYTKAVNKHLTQKEQIQKFQEIVFQKQLCTTPISKIASIVFSLTHQYTNSKIAILSMEVESNQFLIDQCSCIVNNTLNYTKVLSGSEKDNTLIYNSINCNNIVLIGNSINVFLPHEFTDYTALIIFDTNLSEKSDLLKCFFQSEGNLLVFEIL